MRRILSVSLMLVIVGCITQPSTPSEKIVTALSHNVVPAEFTDSNQIKQLNAVLSKVYDEFFSVDELEELCRFYSREDVQNLMQEMRNSVDSQSVQKFEELVRSNLKEMTVDKLKSETFRNKISDAVNNFLETVVYLQ